MAVALPPNHPMKTIPKTTYSLLIALTFGLSCSSTRDNDRPMAKDASGNYATTSQYNAAHRSEFVASIRAGLVDADRRTKDLEARATTLGQAAVNALHEHLPVINEKRSAVVNELARLDAALDNEWPVRRASTEETYKTLRTTLDKAFSKVLGE